MAIICDETFFDGETEISPGKQRKQGGERAEESNLARKRIFLAGHPFALAGQRFSGVVTGGGCENAREYKHLKHFVYFALVVGIIADLMWHLSTCQAVVLEIINY